MKLLITGAGGMLGRDVVLAACIARHAELEVSDSRVLASKFELERPDLMIN